MTDIVKISFTSGVIDGEKTVSTVISGTKDELVEMLSVSLLNDLRNGQELNSIIEKAQLISSEMQIRKSMLSMRQIKK